jgi:very-short-patch-repair endonuclease
MDVIDLTARQQAGRAKARADRERWELLLLHQLRAARVPAPEREYRFHATRKWRFDFAWPEVRLAVEVDGGTWTGGRHTRGKGYREDCVKMADALLAGWRVLRVVPPQVKDGSALRWVEALLRAGVASGGQAHG